MKYDDETLMAYADGELDEAQRAEIAAAIERDPELARRVARHRSLRDQVGGAYLPVLERPVPDRLLEAVRGPADHAGRARAESAPEARPRGNVVPFPARSSRAPAAPWRGREWTAMAASLVLGGVIAWQFMASSTGDIVAKEGTLIARGELASALDRQLASDPPADAAVRIGLSFRSTQGSYCRSFVSRSASAAGLACRQGAAWQVLAMDAIELPAEGLRQAASPAILQSIESRIAGEPLDAAAEASARDAGWK